MLTITSPVPRQVIQRHGALAARAWANRPDGPDRGYGLVPVIFIVDEPCTGHWEYRATLIDDCVGTAVDWRPLDVMLTGDTGVAQARVAAGGWYRLAVRCTRNAHAVAEAVVEPIGVGEVFVIAGQSYAEATNEVRLRNTDPLGRGVALDLLANKWRFANDPLPNASRDGGSIWPPLIDRLISLAQVPVGVVNVARSATASRQWLPGAELFTPLKKAGLAAGRFRAVLWQQGESDVLENTTTDKYVQNVKAIHDASAREWGFAPPWLVAKSTYHPYVYSRPEQEAAIRAAIDELWHTPGFIPGPDTDILGGAFRADREHGEHFSESGQYAAADLWFAAIWPLLQAK